MKIAWYPVVPYPFHQMTKEMGLSPPLPSTSEENVEKFNKSSFQNILSSICPRKKPESSPSLKRCFQSIE